MPIPVRRARFTTWRSLATAATAAALTATFLTPAAAGTPAPRKSEPVYSYDDAVRESVWVDIGLDGDRDGKPDRVAVEELSCAQYAKRVAARL